MLSSLHATDAAGALHRFLDMGIESFLVASSVIGVVGQRLVRRICRYCSVPYEPPAEELAFYRRMRRPREAGVLARRGLQLLLRTGYADRIGVYELLRVTRRRCGS